ncbi:MAG TPA: DUF58 domain-containing protein [candidate division WOR-3 bacterium]|uniref:DUF58 domain-containing protein n=1 Tax=candidate division WOR-3 bacterium TaxID=2052148 RepID=A0A7C0Z9U1_UNCW3|nr:DUF58 domain-containing protein [candidate division WOR-3 bacterium]
MDKGDAHSPSIKKYLDPVVITRLSGLEIKARVVVEGFLSGLHFSPHHGQSLEFSEHLPYSPGDSLHLVDWKVYGRTERLYLKKFHEETNMRVYFLLDVSNSMGYGKPVSKIEYSKVLIASLSYLLLDQNDAVGLIPFNVGLLSFLPPVARRDYIHRLVSKLEAIKTGGKTDIMQVLDSFSRLIKKRSLIIIVSDFLDEPERFFKPIRGFVRSRNEIILLQVLHPDEIELSIRNTVYLRDLETGSRILVNPSAIRARYRTAFNRFLDDLRLRAGETRALFYTVTTDTPYDQVLMKLILRDKR